MKALFPLKTFISVYFIPDVLSFCIPSLFIFITISCSGLVTLSTQLNCGEKCPCSLDFYTSTTHIAPFLSTGLESLESSADTLPLGGSDTHWNTTGVLYIFVLYNLLGPGTLFYRKSNINIKRKQNYEKGWFHNWPMIISHRFYAFPFTNDDFPFYCKSNDVNYSPNSFYKVYLTALKSSKLKWLV